jgi:GNAT superfamily N-acetyltransferase
MPEPTQQPFIRPYNSATDLEAVVHVVRFLQFHTSASWTLNDAIFKFRQTADSALQWEPTWTYASYLWCRPYLSLCPTACFILDDGTGTAVGYCIGTPNTAEFEKRWQTVFVPTLDRAALPPPKEGDFEPTWEDNRPKLILKYLYDNQHGLLHGHYPKLWEGWPGHLHIDILPSHQRQGWGRKLIQTFLEGVKKEECKGVHLGMAGSNDKAEAFYRSLGFRRFPEVLDNGESGEMGRSPGEGDAVVFQVIDL